MCPDPEETKLTRLPQPVNRADKSWDMGYLHAHVSLHKFQQQQLDASHWGRVGGLEEDHRAAAGTYIRRSRASLASASEPTGGRRGTEVLLSHQLLVQISDGRHQTGIPFQAATKLETEGLQRVSGVRHGWLLLRVSREAEGKASV
ncbi:hypothetical protein DPEC_G00049780 [Dallia pectoralis]|uniref:Uncharacterized protein n=1 Tax=Dallia pectoralis TaxID=75939 RepID=A0ACC2HBR3_DALPE|nr:hypothetical protein DPEC_G00049780 [Dallia pectoralis]